MRALGKIIDWKPEEPFGNTEIYTGILDYFDEWWLDEIDPRLNEHHEWLSPPA
jgi:hypothetical protein